MPDANAQLSFRALQLANEQRSAYGLRYSDFTRYRKHCSNRTHRLRSSLKITHGRGKEFKKLPPLKTESIKDGNLQLLLFEAERAWAYSQELSTQALQDTEHTHTLRHSATARFRRAVHWATELLSHAQALHAAGRLSATALAEVTTYTLLTNGRFLRHRADYEDALHQLCVAHRLLDSLGAAAGSTRDQALYALFGDAAGPEIRHCAHELGSDRAYDVPGLVAHFGAQHAGGLVPGYDALVAAVQGEAAPDGTRGQLEPLLWEDEPVPVRNPELVDVLLRVQRAQAKLRTDQGKKSEGVSAATSKRGVAAYDAILLALSDAEDVARKLAEAQKTSGSATSADTGTRDLQFVHVYILYQLLSRRAERDLLLAVALVSSQPSSVKAGKPGAVDARLYPAVVKLLDTILQSLDQMRALSLVDENPDLAAAIDVRIAYTKARRCLFLSRSYAHLKRYVEALSLHRSGSLHLREARSVASTLSAPDAPTPADAFYPLPPAALSALEAEADGDALAAKTAWYALNGGAPDPAAGAGAHKKPLFFDIALNYVTLDMDALERRAGRTPSAPTPAAAAAAVRAAAPAQEKKVAAEEERAETPEPAPTKQSGGLGSLLGGWWGRK